MPNEDDAVHPNQGPLYRGEVSLAQTIIPLKFSLRFAHSLSQFVVVYLGNAGGWGKVKKGAGGKGEGLKEVSEP